ncbi:MAG TPA: hypothetical protein VF754_02535 [Pyrinomonadaceae bacterium]
MNLRKRLLIAAAVCAVGFGSISLGLPGDGTEGVKACGRDGQTAVACGRCGDGQCVKSCGETATSCPRDCGVPSDSQPSATLGESR